MLLEITWCRNWPIKCLVGPIKGRILGNKARVARTLKPTTSRCLLLLGTKDGTWDQTKGDESKETRTNRKIKEVLGPSGSTSIMSIHEYIHEYRATAPSPLTLAYDSKGGRRYSATGPLCVPSNRSITKEERSQNCPTGPRGYTRELSQLHNFSRRSFVVAYELTLSVCTP